MYSNNIIVHKILLDDSLYIKSWTMKYILIKDKIQWSDSNELKDRTIGLLKDEIFKKDKKISYLRLELKTRVLFKVNLLMLHT